MTVRFDQSEHDKLLLLSLKRLKEDGFNNIKAECKEYEKPELLYSKEFNSGFSPDIFAEKDKDKYIIEVETEDSIFTETTEKQWKTFSENAVYYNHKFVVIVKKALEDEAKRQKEYLKVEPDIWTI